MPQVERDMSRVRDTKKRKGSGFQLRMRGGVEPLHHFLANRQAIGDLPANRSVNLTCTNGSPSGHIVLRMSVLFPYEADVLSIDEKEARVIRVYLDDRLVFGSRLREGLRAHSFNELGLSILKGRAIAEGQALLINVRHTANMPVTARLAGIRRGVV